MPAASETRKTFRRDTVCSERCSAITLLACSLADAAELPASMEDHGERGAVSLTNPWGVFTEGSYNWGRKDPGVNEDGFDFDAASVTIGVDYNFGSAVAGASVGYDSYDAEFKLANGGDTRMDSVSGSLFGAWNSERVSLNAIVVYGSLETEITRNIRYGPAPCPFQTCGTDRRLVGKPDGRYFAGGVGLGFDFTVGVLAVVAVREHQSSRPQD